VNINYDRLSHFVEKETIRNDKRIWVCKSYDILTEGNGWPPFGHESIEHEPLTALEQWKDSRHRSLWLVVSN